MNRYWKDVAATMPAVAGDLVARVDFLELPPFFARGDVPLVEGEDGRRWLPLAQQAAPQHMPVLREVQRDE